MTSSDDATRKLRSGSREPLLRVEGLCVYLPLKQGLLRRTVGEVRAVDGVDLRIPQGQTLAVVGEAGAGKSVLARSLTRAVPAKHGKILLDGKDWLGLARSELRALHASVRLLSADTLTGDDPGALLLAALEPAPKLLILDEPFERVSDAARLAVFERLRRLQDEQGVACLLLTRHLALGSALADEVAILHAGQIVETGAAAAVGSQPQHPYTQALLAKRLTPAASEPPSSARRVALLGCRFRGRCADAFARCAEQEPTLFAVAGGLSRCFLNDPEGSSA